MKTKQFLSDLFKLAWQFVKRNGFTLSEALKVAWANMKLEMKMRVAIVKFYFQKVDGSIREAYGTLKEGIVPDTAGNDNRKKNDTVRVYYDTEVESFRCFKKANLIKVA
jgi:hypothetical protein